MGPNRTKIITTGGAGYVPPAIDPSWFANKIRNRAYRTINPLTDYNIGENLHEFFGGKYVDYGDTWKDGDHIYTDYMDKSVPVDVIDDIWAQYLQIPVSKRRFNTRLEESKYRPSLGGTEDQRYYKLPLSWHHKDNLISETNSIPIGANKNSRVLEDYNLETHTVGRGFDDKGEYRSYYDRWDINPFKGTYRGLRIPILSGFGDVSAGVGKPVNIYDRIYLDDYYGVPNPTHATYLPEINVYSKKAKDQYTE